MMAEYVPITKELRDYLNSMTPYEAFSPWVDNDTVLAMLDSIDAIHRSLEQENERLRDASKRGDDWIKLPVDADGEPIHIGDWIVNPDISNQKQKVAAIAPDSVYWWGETGCHWRRSHLVRHYHPDTWERIIEDAIRGDGGNYGCLEERFNATVPALVARCKALAGEGE